MKNLISGLAVLSALVLGVPHAGATVGFLGESAAVHAGFLESVDGGVLIIEIGLIVMPGDAPAYFVSSDDLRIEWNDGGITGLVFAGD